MKRLSERFVSNCFNHSSLIPYPFNRVDFRQSSPMAFFACEARRDEGAHDLHCEFLAYDPRSEAEHIAIVMLA